MALVPLSGPRATISETTHGLQITIPARRNWFVMVFLGFWLFGWLFGEIFAPVMLLKSAHEANFGAVAFMTVWLCGWTVGGGFAALVFLWMICGKEVILVNSSRVKISKVISRYSHDKEFDVAHVKNLRVAPVSFNPMDWSWGLQWWGIGGGLIAFDYSFRTYRFATGVDEAEAKLIIDAVQTKHGSLK